MILDMRLYNAHVLNKKFEQLHKSVTFYFHPLALIQLAIVRNSYEMKQLGLFNKEKIQLLRLKETRIGG